MPLHIVSLPTHRWFYQKLGEARILSVRQSKGDEFVSDEFSAITNVITTRTRLVERLPDRHSILVSRGNELVGHAGLHAVGTNSLQISRATKLLGQLPADLPRAYLALA